jgi:hypothetical protein
MTATSHRVTYIHGLSKGSTNASRRVCRTDGRVDAPESAVDLPGSIGALRGMDLVAIRANGGTSAVPVNDDPSCPRKTEPRHSRHDLARGHDGCRRW